MKGRLMGNKNDNNSQVLRRYLNLLEKEKHYQIINDFSLNIMYLDTEEELVWYMVESVISKMNLEDCVLYLVEGNKLVQKAASSNKLRRNRVIQSPITLEIGEGIVGEVAYNAIPKIVNDLSNYPNYIIDDERRLSEIAVPILCQDKVLGVIDSEHSEKDYFNEEHLVLLSSIAFIIGIKLTNIRAIQQLKENQKNLEEKVELKTRELKNTIDTLHKSNKNLENFAHSISHDVRQPLRTIYSFLQLLQENEPEMKEASKEFLDFALKGAKDMTSLVDGLLEYSKLNYSDEKHVILDPNQVIKRVISNLRVDVSEKKAKFNISSLPKIKGNETQIYQLFQNLIFNAIKFRKEEVDPVVDVSFQEKEDRILVFIVDNGKGIKLENQEYIFQLFYQGMEKKDGYGIGLSLCKKIMENHQGEIDVLSQEGVGTTFILSFPKI